MPSARRRHSEGVVPLRAGSAASNQKTKADESRPCVPAVQ